MKALFPGKKILSRENTCPSTRGFSTLEILVAFAIISIILVGVILADFNAQYWAITSKTSNTALYKAKISIENSRAAAKSDFLSVQSTPLATSSDASCENGGLCYFLQTIVTDLSPCSKYLQAKAVWQVRGYPTSTTSLYTYLTNPKETVALGGDCTFTYPAGNWSDPEELRTVGISGDAVTGVDALGGNVYVTTDEAPYLQIVTPIRKINFSTPFATTTPFNAIDVAHDEATGRTYAFLGASSTSSPFQVADLTDINTITGNGNAFLVAKKALRGITSTSTDILGWRLTFYDRNVYMATRYISGSSREFHVFDVNDPNSPIELGSGFKLNTSAYAILVRDQFSGGSVRRFAYLATTADHAEVQILDVTIPESITLVRTIDLDPNDICSATLPDARTLALSGTTLYVGEDYRTTAPCSALPELYAFDVSDPYRDTPLLSSLEIGANVFGLRANGSTLFVAASHDGTSEVQIRSSAPPSFALIRSLDIPNLFNAGDHRNPLDVDGDLLFIGRNNSSHVQVFHNR